MKITCSFSNLFPWNPQHSRGREPSALVMSPNVCNDSKDGIIMVHCNSQRQWVIIFWKEINVFQPDVPAFFPLPAGSNCVHQSNKHQLRNTEARKHCVSFLKCNGFCFAAQFPLFPPATQVWECILHVSKYWQSLFYVCFSADHSVHVLWDHAEQVGDADLSARLHEEPPGLPPRPSSASVALLQLHVHARWVRTATSAHG